MAKKYFSQYPPFINRKKETTFLKEYFRASPSKILFIYGPKSTGKTTLLTRVLEKLDDKKHAINYIDLRGVLIGNFKDFKSIFFTKDLKGKVKSIISGIKMNVGFFGRSVDDEDLLQDNVFALMEKKLVEANEQGIKPIIIVDEFQYLKDIIINKEDNLLLVEELRKLFIRLTKVRHLCHIICATSDSYYMEELYNHAKLKNTSKFYLVDHLAKEDIHYRLHTKEKMPIEAVEYFREHLGGSVWEIRQAFVDYKNGHSYEKSIQEMIQAEYGRIAELYNTGMSGEEREVFNKISKILSQKGVYAIPLGQNIIGLIKKLVDLDIWFYDPIMQTLIANSPSIKKAFERLYK